GRGAERAARRSRCPRTTLGRRPRGVGRSLLLGRRRRADPGAVLGADRVTILAIAFWISVGLLVYTHLGYPALLWLLARLRGTEEDLAEVAEPPGVSLIVAAHDEEAVIERKVRDALALDYPRERLEVIVASDGSSDRTVELARAAGADLVLDLPRGGKVAALNAAVERAGGAVLAFSDANSFWEPDALRRLVARLAGPEVGYVCGQVRFDAGAAASEEGLYWRYEMAVRALESRLGGVTAGNGATNVALVGQGAIYVVTLAAQAGLLAAAALGMVLPARPLRIAHYYVAVTAASAVGLWDYLRRGVPSTWEKAEGTR